MSTRSIWGETVLYAAVELQDVAAVKFFLSHNVDLDKGGPMEEPWRTGLQQAVVENSLILLAALLKHGANVNMPGHDLGSTLQAAVHMRRTAIIQQLLDAGADTSQQGSRYGSPLHAAMSDVNTEIALRSGWRSGRSTLR